MTLAPQPRTQARSSRVESDWDFGFALGVMGKAKRKTRLADYNFKMAESNYAKLEEKKKNHLECFQRKESSPARLEGQNPLSSHSSIQ